MAGMECLWQVEKDPFCQKVLAKHWPNVKRYEDIKDVKKPESVDLICGGFPCQPFSVAGKRGGQTDDRYLWPEMLRIIQEVRPRWVIGENVPGIINLALDQVFADLENEGYTCWTFIIPACAVDAPHRRDRVWIVANSERNMHRFKERRRFGKTEKIQGIDRAENNASGESCRTSPIWRTGNNNVSHDEGRINREHHAQPEKRQEPEFGKGISAENVADTSRKLRERSRNIREAGRSEFTIGGKNVPHAHMQRCKEQRVEIANGPKQFGAELCSRWAVEPELGRVANGIPRRVDRLRSLGNAVVPQVVEVIGRMIIDYEK